MINPAKRTNSIELSQIRKMFEVTNPDAINLGIGEPDFDVPKNIKDAMKKSIDENDTHYTPNKGYIELREEIVKKFKKENEIDANPENVIVTVGASEGLYLCAQAFFEKGDEIILPNPSFLSYEACINLAGGTITPVDCKMENEFKLKADDVYDKINENTKAIILNSPSNPTGAVMDKEDIKAIADLSMDKNFLIISDEIYEKIIYDKKHYSPAKYSDNVITLNGFSKTYAMTGLRIGYLTANDENTEELLKIHQYNIACASTTSQRGAYEALTGPQDEVEKMVHEFKNRRDLIVSRLNGMGYETVNAEGAFYVFPKIEDKDFVKKAANAGVITVPGEAFGSNECVCFQALIFLSCSVTFGCNLSALLILSVLKTSNTLFFSAGSRNNNEFLKISSKFCFGEAPSFKIGTLIATCFDFCNMTSFISDKGRGVFATVFPIAKLVQ